MHRVTTIQTCRHVRALDVRRTGHDKMSHNSTVTRRYDVMICDAFLRFQYAVAVTNGYDDYTITTVDRDPVLILPTRATYGTYLCIYIYNVDVEQSITRSRTRARTRR